MSVFGTSDEILAQPLGFPVFSSREAVRAALNGELGDMFREPGYAVDEVNVLGLSVPQSWVTDDGMGELRVVVRVPLSHVVSEERVAVR